MENKNIIIIAVVVIVIIAILGVIFATGVLNQNNHQNMKTTPFDNDFMEGSFVGDVELVNKTEKYMQSYEDKEHEITYNISTVDNSSALMEIYEIQGVSNPEHRSYGGNDWNIYFTQAVPGNSSNASDNETMNIIICQCQGKKQGYFIYMITKSSSKINSTNFLDEGFEVYLKPLLKSLTLKESNDVPKVYEEFGMSKEQFNQQLELVHQYKAGNRSALNGAQ